MYVVTFRNSYDLLTSMFTEKYSSVKAAKNAIQFDAEVFKAAHNHTTKHDAYCGNKRRVSAKWVKPKTEDYYEVKAKDGTSCIWQYFEV